MPFDELSTLTNNLPYLCATLNVAKIHLYTDASESYPQPEVQQAAVPGKPSPHFYFSEDLSGPPPPAVDRGLTAARTSPSTHTIAKRPAKNR